MERILRATATVGLSSLLVVALGAVRYKLVAMELGAPGVGLLGILMSAMTFGAILFSLGLTASGVQATAAAGDDVVRFQRTRAALLRGSWWLGGLGGLLVPLLGITWGANLLPKPVTSVLIVWLGVALAATVVSGGHLALLNGIGRIRALAVSNALGSVVGTVVTIVAIYSSGQAGLVSALVAAPVATLACTLWFLAKEPKLYPRPKFSQWWPELRGMITLGGVVMLGLLLGSAAQLVMRVWLQQGQGLASVGHFQAAWTVTNLYLGFVLTALAVEYYPRISTQIADPGRLNVSVDRQIRIALLLGTPVLLWMMILSPLALSILYTPDFQLATGILRWQLLGDIFKIVGWAIAFLLLARKARGAYFVAELTFNVCYLALGLPLASQNGLSALGAAYLGSYALYLAVLLWLANRETEFKLQRPTFMLLVTLLLVGSATLWAVESNSTLGLSVATILASVVSLASLVTLIRWRTRERRSGDEVGTLV